jgi:hypothetical protein
MFEIKRKAKAMHRAQCGQKNYYCSVENEAANSNEKRLESRYCRIMPESLVFIWKMIGGKSDERNGQICALQRLDLKRKGL